MQFVLLAADLSRELTFSGLAWVWRQCDGVQRAERRLKRLEERGFVTSEINPMSLARVVRITEAGRRAALGGEDPQELWGRAWDGKWRWVVFDLPERNRALRMRLRRTLRKMRFGYLQDSVWISPDPAEFLLKALAEQTVDADMLTLIEGTPCGEVTDMELVAGTWNFDSINQQYQTYLELLRTRPLGSPGTPGRKQAWRQWLRIEMRAWEAASVRDPMLPERLLPAVYLGKEAWYRRLEVLQALPLQPPRAAR